MLGPVHVTEGEGGGVYVGGRCMYEGVCVWVGGCMCVERGGWGSMVVCMSTVLFPVV